jgi:hypothetical protein
MAETASPYLDEAWQSLPRLLASFDRDPLSPTLGLGDRTFWSWKTHDFANATPQGAVNGLARLVAARLLPKGMDEACVIDRIDEMIQATRTITARDGSLVEAFPNEKSFCVTALVAFDILCATDHLGDRVDPARLAVWRKSAAPLIDFIVSHNETHAIISNHLATAVAALTRWTGPGAASAEARAKELRDIILDNQSREGWYSEYGSADPGYETLGLYYLADVHLRRPDLGLAALACVPYALRTSRRLLRRPLRSAQYALHRAWRHRGACSGNTRRRRPGPLCARVDRPPTRGDARCHRRPQSGATLQRLLPSSGLPCRGHGRASAAKASV